MRFQFISAEMMMVMCLIVMPLWAIFSILFYCLLHVYIHPLIPLPFWLKSPMSFCFACSLGYFGLLEPLIFLQRVRGEVSYAEHLNELKIGAGVLGYLLTVCAVTIAFYLAIRPFALNLDFLQIYTGLFSFAFLILSLYLGLTWSRRWKKPQPKQL